MEIHIDEKNVSSGKWAKARRTAASGSIDKRYSSHGYEIERMLPGNPRQVNKTTRTFDGYPSTAIVEPESLRGQLRASACTTS